MGFEFPKVFSRSEQSSEDDKEREKMKKQEQTPEAPERTVSQIEQEFEAAQKERADLGVRYRSAKDRGDMGITLQRRLFRADENIARLREELEKKRGEGAGL